MFIRFQENFPPTCLFHPTRLLGTLDYLIHEKKWAWHHPGGGHAPLTRKALLLLKLV